VKYNGPFEDSTQPDIYQRIDTTYVAFDALYFPGGETLKE
jgi:hypothetical protein